MHWNPGFTAFFPDLCHFPFLSIRFFFKCFLIFPVHVTPTTDNLISLFLITNTHTNLPKNYSSNKTEFPLKLQSNLRVRQTAPPCSIRIALVSETYFRVYVFPIIADTLVFILLNISATLHRIFNVNVYWEPMLTVLLHCRSSSFEFMSPADGSIHPNNLVWNYWN